MARLRRQVGLQFEAAHPVKVHISDQTISIGTHTGLQAVLGALIRCRDLAGCLDEPAERLSYRRVVIDDRDDCFCVLHPICYA